MLEIFHYSFMIRAFIAGIIISLIAPLIGTFLVAKRYSLIADTLAHVSLAGVALGLFLGIYPAYSALFTSIIAAILIEKIRKGRFLSGDTALAMLLSGGLALAIILLSLAKGFNVDLFSYLFGSITTVGTADLLLMIPLGIVVFTIIILLQKELFYIAIDEETAQASGIPVKILNLILLFLTAITVALSIRIIGVLLIGALMVIPVVSATQVAKSFKQTLLFSIIFSLVSVILGLFLSYFLNIPAGGTIVLTSLVIFGLAFIFKH